MNQHDTLLAEKDSIELLRAVKKMGLPSFQEYCKLTEEQRSRYKLNASNIFNLISDNKQPLGSVRRFKHIFKTLGGTTYECGDSLEKIESIMREEGLTHRDIEFKPEVRETETTGFYIEVTWQPKKPKSGIIGV